jgi:uncharacterized protein (TIGR02452 family)
MYTEDLYNNKSNSWREKVKRSEEAIIHTSKMEKEYGPKIAFSVENTHVYDNNNVLKQNTTCAPIMQLIKYDTVGEILYIKSMEPESVTGKVAALNFASYKNPGGKFLEGSIAQEEALCHESFLYNVLREFDSTFYEWNRNNLNKGMYMNRALYTPKVIFERSKTRASCDIITCACPNKSVGLRYGAFSTTDNLKALTKRVNFVRQVAESEGVNTLIVGAFGCGVFKQDPKEVANVFLSQFSYTCNIHHVIFAIPGGENYETFSRYIPSIN